MDYNEMMFKSSEIVEKWMKDNDWDGLPTIVMYRRIVVDLAQTIEQLKSENQDE